ncbi:MAG: DegT/DnrJ/EryC1/StrS family aminotransferase [Nitrospirae bacterium]|nr:MAG: DegT/DnrJ/EryC1/StrS family aminotransferase [Nitrospirota bacterium]
MKIPMVDLRSQYRDIKKEVEDTIKEILESGQFILGPHVREFEREVAAYHGCKYAVGVASGTDALHLSLMALGIGEGDEVITTPFSFIAAAEAIVYVGAKPVFVDVDPETFNIDPFEIKKRITPKTKCILPVHLFGMPAEMDGIMDIASEYGLNVIEDCAQAFGAEYNGRKVGTFGSVGCFSFYPSKNLGCYGDGGMVITEDPILYEKLILLRNHGSPGGYRHIFIGRNSRLDEIQAAILRIKLKRIDSYNNRRRAVADLYRRLIGEIVICPEEKKGLKHVYHQFTIRYRDRDMIKEKLERSGVSSVVYYPIGLHKQEAFLGLIDDDNLPVTEMLTKEVLSLPIYPELKEEDVTYIADCIKESISVAI